MWRCRQGADTLDGLQVPSDHDLARVALDEQREGLLDDVVAGELTLLDGAVEAAGLLVADGYGDLLPRRLHVDGRADEPIFLRRTGGLGEVEQACSTPAGARPLPMTTGARAAAYSAGFKAGSVASSR